MTLTDAEVAAMATWSECEEYAETLKSTDVEALALEVQESRALRSVMAEAVRDVHAGEITTFDALARIVAELASLDSRAVADGH